MIHGNMAKLSAQKSASNILIKKRESNSSNETPVSANINNDINQQVKTGKIIFNSKKTSEKQGQYSPNYFPYYYYFDFCLIFFVHYLYSYY